MAVVVVAVAYVTAFVVAIVVVDVVVGDGPPLPPRIVYRSSMVKLELRVEKYPPAKPVAPEVRAGS